MTEGPDIAGLVSLGAGLLGWLALVAPLGLVPAARLASGVGEAVLVAFVLVPLLSCPVFAATAIGAGGRASRRVGSLPGRAGAALGGLALLGWGVLLLSVFLVIPAFLLF